MSYIVKWEETYLASWGDDEQRTYSRKHAAIFSSVKEAEVRVERIRQFRKIENYEVLQRENF